MDKPLECQVTVRLKDQTGSLKCEGPRGHKGHHHFQMMADIHRPQEECRHCDAVKAEKRVEQKVQVSFYLP